MTAPEPTNRFEQYVIDKLEALDERSLMGETKRNAAKIENNTRLSAIEDDVSKIKTDLVVMRTRAATIGALAGGAMALIGFIMSSWDWVKNLFKAA